MKDRFLIGQDSVKGWGVKVVDFSVSSELRLSLFAGNWGLLKNHI